MKRIKHIIGASLAALLLISCGGGGGVSGGGSASSVKVFGDSLADSGTFGFRFTVNQAGPNGTATPIWVDKIASSLAARYATSTMQPASLTLSLRALHARISLWAAGSSTA
jgi:outer membrane lipase/esterase